MKFSFSRPFLGQCYYILSLSDLCMEVKKKIFKEIMQFQYMIYMAMPYHKNPCPGGHIIYNFRRSFLGHHYYIFSLLEQCPGAEKKIFKEKHQFYTFYAKITSRWGGGSWNLQFHISLPNKCYIHKGKANVTNPFGTPGSIVRTHV